MIWPTATIAGVEELEQEDDDGVLLATPAKSYHMYVHSKLNSQHDKLKIKLTSIHNYKSPRTF